MDYLHYQSTTNVKTGLANFWKSNHCFRNQPLGGVNDDFFCHLVFTLNGLLGYTD